MCFDYYLANYIFEFLYTILKDAPSGLLICMLRDLHNEKFAHKE
jgi:hypothetical protein